MKLHWFSLILFFISYLSINSTAQDFSNSGWHIEAKDIDPNDYYGVTVANGMVGLISSPEPMKVKDVVLNGVYDYYQRGRVSNILKTFSHMNMNMIVNDVFLNKDNIQNYAQILDMKGAKLITTFDVGRDASVRQELMSLRNMPYTSLLIVEIRAKRKCDITAINEIIAPDHSLM